VSYPFTLFVRPNGDRRELEMTKIRQKDADFLRKHDVKISMEDCGIFTTIWADDGRTLEDDPSTPDEITYIVHGSESCEDAMHNICELVRKRQMKLFPPSPLERAKSTADWHKARSDTEGQRSDD
jgi:hypothetical protein